jgi:hypothetical protein
MLIEVGKQNGQRGDGVMVAADDEALAHVYCKRGLKVQFKINQGLDHTNAAVPFESDASTFLDARLHGVPAVNGCATIGRGDSIAPIKRHRR